MEIVEDNENNINTLSNYLLAKGYRLHVARSGPQMDVQMPGMDVIQTIHQIRSNEQNNPMPIIALTAGANDYLSKPLSMKRLVALIEQYAKQTA